MTTIRLASFVACLIASIPVLAADPIDLGSRRELFVDDYLIEKLTDAELELQHPNEGEVVLVHDKPWEGNVSTYHTVFRDGDLYRLYYRGGHHREQSDKPAHKEFCCYAESKDGVHWHRPSLGMVEFEGSKDNNIILEGHPAHNFSPFKDENPNCKPDERYKAVSGTEGGGLYVYKSSDAIHWEPIVKDPVTKAGYFDSLNTAHWDPNRKCYVEYHRQYRNRLRDIMLCTSDDFVHWSKPTWLSYSGAPPQHLYTNAIVVYERAPQLLMGFPMRHVIGRNPEGHSQDGVADAVFMTSRDGQNFHRWNEAFIRPGSQPDRWVNRNNMPTRGVVVTKPEIEGAPDELSLYATEGYYRGPAVRLRRYTLRLDGFVSVSVGPDGGEVITKPLTFEAADRVGLSINFATSAVGSLRCEVQDLEGRPIEGYALDDSDEVYGDSIDRILQWSGESNLSKLAGKPVRLRFVLHDADLYSIQFQPTAETVAELR